MYRKIKRIVRDLYDWVKLLPHYLSAEYSRLKYQERIEKVMTDYDMVKEEAEKFFKHRYMAVVSQLINKKFNGCRNLRVLDAGCGQGRIAIELAKMGCYIEAVDSVKDVIDKGKEYAKIQGVENLISWKHGELPEVLSAYKNDFYDIVICFEVLYMMPFQKSKATFESLAKKVKGGGILIVSLRTRYFYFLYSLLNKDFLKLKWAAEHNDFIGLGESISWIDPEQIIELFKNSGFSGVSRKSIGMISGIKGDPTGVFCLPALLTEDQKKIVGEIEDKYGEIYPDSGRYLLVWGEKQ
ncbi:MAG: class I SAM-dependent methyltransferase [Candidatus Omnitrophica bacterium]|nr:class I SAM-dependent methyltransferase [Candidatus Omnitrophota bacterium]